MTLILSADELKQYHRQMLTDGWGEAAQMRLKAAEVFVAGAGGLGSPTAIYLAVAGVGQLRICDFDNLERSNLNRQILHDASRIGMNKALSADTTLAKLNNFVRVTPLTARITESNVDDLVGSSQIILDCMDNFATRYVLSDCALRKRIPIIHAAVRGLEGRLAFLAPPETACMHCIVPEAPPAETFPVVGATPGIVGAMQALEAIKYLAGYPTPLKGRMLIWHGDLMETYAVNLKRDPACASCATGNLAAEKTVPQPHPLRR